MDLGDGGCFRGQKCNFGIYEPIWSFYTLKCSHLSHHLRFEVTDRIQEMEVVLEAENVTLVFMNRFGRSILQNAHTKNVKWGYLSHILGFKVTEGIQETEAILETEDVTLVFMNRFGHVLLQNVHKNIKKGGYLSHLLGFEFTEWSQKLHFWSLKQPPSPRSIL